MGGSSLCLAAWCWPGLGLHGGLLGCLSCSGWAPRRVWLCKLRCRESKGCECQVHGKIQTGEQGEGLRGVEVRHHKVQRGSSEGSEGVSFVTVFFFNGFV